MDYVHSPAYWKEEWNTDIRFKKVIGRILMYMISLWETISKSSHGLTHLFPINFYPLKVF